MAEEGKDLTFVEIKGQIIDSKFARLVAFGQMINTDSHVKM